MLDRTVLRQLEDVYRLSSVGSSGLDSLAPCRVIHDSSGHEFVGPCVGCEDE